MWNLLVNFESRVTQHLFSDEEDKPMARLIGKLKQKEYAKFVYAYTSLFTLGVTLQAKYNDPPKDGISISFDPRTTNFFISYYDVKEQTSIGYRCVERMTESLIDAFVLRMFLTENNDPIKFETEETPTFQIGQQVETIIDEYSRKYHKGTVFKIEKHHEQNRFMYFIEVNGKRLKKRYFKDNLKAV